MPRRRRPDLGRRRQSNVRLAMSRANRTDEQQNTKKFNSRIGMSELCSRVIENGKFNEFVHIKHNNSNQNKMNFNDSAGTVVM